MKQPLNKVVNNLYTGQQKLEVKEIIREYKEGKIDNYKKDYKILTVAIQDDIVPMTTQEIEEFYNIQSQYLGEIDFIIANLLNTLSKLTGKDIKSGYENALVLDKTQSEFTYLVNEVEQYLSK